MKEAYQVGKYNSTDVRIVTASIGDNDQFELYFWSMFGSTEK